MLISRDPPVKGPPPGPVETGVTKSARIYSSFRFGEWGKAQRRPLHTLVCTRLNILAAQEGVNEI
jgi:hypothetical protein